MMELIERVRECDDPWFLGIPRCRTDLALLIYSVARLVGHALAERWLDAAGDLFFALVFLWLISTHDHDVDDDDGDDEPEEVEDWVRSEPMAVPA